jgi:hypothetical protein
MVLHVLAIYFFYQVVSYLFNSVVPSKDLRYELPLLTAGFAFHPLIVSNSINLCLDHAVMTFFLYFLFCLFYERRFQFYFASFILMASKEPGVILYLSSIFAYLVFFVLRINAPTDQKIRNLRSHFYFAVPILFFFAYFLAKLYFKTTIVDPQFQARGAQLFSTEIISSYFLVYLLELLVLNFNWVFAIFPLYVLVRLIAYWLIGKVSPKPQIRSDSRIFPVLLTAFAVAFFGITRYAPPTNARYLIPILPIALIFVYQSLIFLFKEGKWRSGILAVTLILFCVSNNLTLDPLSRLIFKTFPFDGHQLLKMTSLTNEPVGHGRDQDIYNLESLEFHYAVNEILSTYQPTIFVTPLASSAWLDIGPLDEESFQRTFHRKHRVIPITLEPNLIAMLKDKPKSLLYFGLPYFDYQKGLETLKRDYQEISAESFGREGYRITAYAMRLKDEKKYNSKTAILH